MRTLLLAENAANAPVSPHKRRGWLIAQSTSSPDGLAGRLRARPHGSPIRERVAWLFRQPVIAGFSRAGGSIALPMRRSTAPQRGLEHSQHGTFPIAAATLASLQG